MKMRTLALVFGIAVVAIVVAAAGALRAQQSPAFALTGRVSSAAEGMMEGVVVSARREGSPITVSVVSDARGRYAFPAGRLMPGVYRLSIRAVGYDLAAPSGTVLVQAQTSNDDLRLVPTKNLEDQISDGEWVASAPGTPEQKTALLDCTGCHSIQRIVDSYHTEAEFRTIVMPRMANYGFQSFWLRPQAFKPFRSRNLYSPLLPAYLASINQSAGPRAWQPQPLPRLKGASTHIIVTRYDLPSKLIQPHDVVGADGAIWFCDFGQQYLGRLDPKTGHVTLFSVPINKIDNFTGSLDLETDSKGNLWLAQMTQGQVVRFDPKTRTFTQFRVPPGANPQYTQESMVSPTFDSADGKVWTNNQDEHAFRRLDPATGTWESFGPFYYPNTTRTFNAYGMPTDTSNGVWGLDFGGESIAHLTPTGTFTIIPTPTKGSHPRRGHVDPRTGLLWFAEWGVNQVASIDTKTPNAPITEYKLPTPWDSPYDVVADKNGEVWTGSMLTDRISRLNPATGKVLDYQLPSFTNTRRVWIDNSTNPVTFWTGANHEAAIVRLETLQ